MLIARAVRERQVIHLRDAKDSEPYRRGVPLAVFSADRAGIRTILMVPLSKEDDGLGLLTIYRREVAGRGVDDLQHLGGRGLLL